MKTLELKFANEMGKVVTVSVDGPKEPVDIAQIAGVMDIVIESDVFNSSGGSLIERLGARIVERSVENIVFN